ncbi:phosphoribosylglycinamide formyltransferase [Xylariomycetidae sp. FL0641]|nr:phosphoribosylglycinamide formyltransferase [Xylariomycetidae sp. FL0641]
MAEPCHILVMASGNGSNFQALIDAVENGKIANSKIVRLIVNRKNAYAVKRAENHGIPWTYFNLITDGFQIKGEKDAQKLLEARDKYDAALALRILGNDPKPDMVVLAGWMHVFAQSFLDPLVAEGIPVINLHPALPGKYDGAHAIERAFNDFQAGKLENNKTGIMIHHVISEVDRGAPILVKDIECREGESLENLEERIHSHEHELIVEATAQMAKEIYEKKRAAGNAVTQ